MVKVSYNKVELYDELTERYDIFEHYYDVMMFLAVLCYRDGKPRTKSEESDGERTQIAIKQFHNNPRYHAIVACLAFQRRGDPTAMADAEVHADIIPQYAAGGLRVYEEEFGEIAGDPTDAIANYINSCAEADDTSREDDELQTILKNFENLTV